MAFRLEPPIENGSSPRGVTTSFTSRGFGVAATIDTAVGDPSGRTFFSSVKNHAVGDVGRQFQAVGYDFLLGVLVGITHPDLARGTVDQDFHGTLKRRTLLHEVVVQEAEGTALRKYGSLIADRTVAETEHEVVGDAIAMSDLDQVSIGEDIALQRAQHEKAVD